MAEYIRFRWTRAKAGVTMAFLALLGGLLEKSADAKDGQAKAHGAAVLVEFQPTLSLRGINGNLRTDLTKLDKALNTVYAKDQKAISGAVNKIYAKIENNFLSQSDAGKVYLTSEDASKIYLKDGATAANSELLGNLPESAFIHGSGGVATGALTVTLNGGTMPLLTATDGSVSVQAEFTGNGPSVVITNSTANAMTWIATIGGVVTEGTIGGNGGQATLALPSLAVGKPGVSQATVQLVPGVQHGPASTLTVSTEPSSSPSGGQMFVGQMLNGDG